MNTFYKRGVERYISPILILFESVIRIGTREELSSVQKLNVIISNSFALVFALGAVFIWISSLFFLKGHLLVWLLPGLCAAFLLPIYLNYKEYYSSSRIVLSICPSLIILAYSVISKLTVSDITFNDFYNFRIALSILCILPLWIFSIKELALLCWTFIFNFLCVSMTDVVHDCFNVGYYDLGFIDQGYDFLNVTTITCTLILAYGIVFMKKRMEDSELRNGELVDKLSVSLEKIQFQNNELVDQAKKLRGKQLELNQANSEIEKNRKRLEEELAIYDHEITQFSYNVCHHLRGPIASIAGLVNLLHESRGPHSEIDHLLFHFRQTTDKLESVVDDLNQILGVRKDIFRIRSMVGIKDLLDEAMTLLHREIDRANAMVYVSIEDVDLIFTSRVSVVNILYNLLANSLKFRSQKRVLQIQVKCWSEGELIKVQIRDNGLGFDSDRFKDQLFQMYKRFHEHVEGKGLGLYLVKLQLTALGGTVKIESVPDGYTTCCLTLPEKSIRLIDINNN